MSAPRSRTTSGPAAVFRRSEGGSERPHDAVDPNALQQLARRWGEAATPPQAPTSAVVGPQAPTPPAGIRAAPTPAVAPAAVEHRLATILRRLAGVLRAEPFHPSDARELGAALIEAGLSAAPADVLAVSLPLLRDESPAVLGVPGIEGAQRLQAALDQLVGGFVAAQADPPPPTPNPGPAAADLRLTMADDAPVGVAVMALDGRVLAANPELTAFLDLGDVLVEPRPFTDFVHADDLPEALERYARLLRGEPDTQRMDLRVVRPDGVILWVRIIARLVHAADGEPSHIVVVAPGRPRPALVARGIRARTARPPARRIGDRRLAPAGVRERHHPRRASARSTSTASAPSSTPTAPVSATGSCSPWRAACGSRRASTRPPVPAATSSPCSSPTPRTSAPCAASRTDC